jgi:hypothetical protein
MKTNIEGYWIDTEQVTAVGPVRTVKTGGTWADWQHAFDVHLSGSILKLKVPRNDNEPKESYHARVIKVRAALVNLLPKDESKRDYSVHPNR